MTFSLGELAKLTNSEFKGDEEIKLNNIASLDEANDGDISFVSNSKYINALNSSKASVVILSQSLAEDYSGNSLINNDPYLTFAKVVKLFHPVEKLSEVVNSEARISKTAEIGNNVSIAENVVIDDFVKIKEGVTIGAGSYVGRNSIIEKDSLLHSNVTLYSDTELGANSIVHSGAVIGADGFGYAPQEDKSWYKILQVGNVVIGSDVEVGANSTIDRAALGSTTIGNGVKIDNQIQIGHNVSIGDHTAIAAGVLVAGSTRIGKYCQIAGAVAIAGHLDIVDNVVITGKSTVTKSIKKSGVYSSGIPISENKKWRRNAARFNQLDDMAKTIKRLEAKLIKLEEGLK